ncbi:MAG: hypothetical protein ACRD9R_19190 [Pyrinomonadaceae bacterium]
MNLKKRVESLEGATGEPEPVCAECTASFARLMTGVHGTSDPPAVMRHTPEEHAELMAKIEKIYGKPERGHCFKAFIR